MCQIEHRPGKFSRLLIVSMAIKRRAGRKGSLVLGFRGRTSHRKFSLREPAENSIGMVWILVSRDERPARLRNTDVSRQVSRGRKSLVFFIPSLSLSVAPLFVSRLSLTSRIWEVNRKERSQAASHLGSFIVSSIKRDEHEIYHRRGSFNTLTDSNRRTRVSMTISSISKS